jgi:uncharacterized membrane protein
MQLYDVARWLHIGAGMTAVATFWLPLVVHKGGPLHRRVGWVFTWAMAVSSVTAIGLSLWRLVTFPQQRPMALFFLYVGVLSASAVSMGIRALRHKTRTGPHRNVYDLGISALLVLTALVVLGYGLATGHSLLWGFATMGLLGGGSDLLYWLRPPSERMHWWYQHMGGMVGGSIAALAAFLVNNVRHLGVNGLQLGFFLGPTVLGLVGLKLWERAYRRRFGASPPRAQPAGATP